MNGNVIELVDSEKSLRLRFSKSSKKLFFKKTQIKFFGSLAPVFINKIKENKKTIQSAVFS